MTHLNKPVTRRTDTTSKGKRIVVTIAKDALVFRLERCRYRYTLPIKTAWVYAAILTANAKRAEKAQARKARAHHG